MFKKLMDSIEATSLRYPPTRLRFFEKLRGADRVLELGCGSGGNLGALREVCPEAEIHGIDVRSSALPEYVNYHEVDIDKGKLPFADEYFDAILMIHVIEHLNPYPLKLGAEMRRVLKPGGRLYVETPNWTSMFVPSFGFKREQSFPFNFFDYPTHIRPWTKHGLFEFLSKACGLKVETVQTLRDISRLPLDPLGMATAFFRGKRPQFLGSFANVYGWNIYGVGSKA